MAMTFLVAIGLAAAPFALALRENGAGCEWSRVFADGSLQSLARIAGSCPPSEHVAVRADGGEAFASAGALYRVDLGSGAVRALPAIDGATVEGLAWMDDEPIVFASRPLPADMPDVPHGEWTDDLEPTLFQTLAFDGARWTPLESLAQTVFGRCGPPFVEALGLWAPLHRGFPFPGRPLDDEAAVRALDAGPPDDYGWQPHVFNRSNWFVLPNPAGAIAFLVGEPHFGGPPDAGDVRRLGQGAPRPLAGAEHAELIGAVGDLLLLRLPELGPVLYDAARERVLLRASALVAVPFARAEPHAPPPSPTTVTRFVPTPDGCDEERIELRTGSWGVVEHLDRSWSECHRDTDGDREADDDADDDGIVKRRGRLQLRRKSGLGYPDWFAVVDALEDRELLAAPGLDL
jgi:hypothetical protein